MATAKAEGRQDLTGTDLRQLADTGAGRDEAGINTAVRPSVPPPAPKGGGLDAVVEERGERIDHKIRAARRILDALAPNDRRRRLLHAAIVRRDEVLLDGLLGKFEQAGKL